ncbi:MAG: hypothetical protein ACPIOQ_75295, partial [Promethearchaeia archaeon]
LLISAGNKRQTRTWPRDHELCILGRQSASAASRTLEVERNRSGRDFFAPRALLLETGFGVPSTREVHDSMVRSAAYEKLNVQQLVFTK